MRLPVGIAASMLACGIGASSAAPPLLEVSVDGGRLQGRPDGTLAVFQGIRYAAPPVGELRWRAPQPAPPWLGVQAAQAPGASCIQKPGMSIDNGGGDVGPIEEDCLFLTVWTPADAPAARLPVMV